MPSDIRCWLLGLTILAGSVVTAVGVVVGLMWVVENHPRVALAVVLLTLLLGWLPQCVELACHILGAHHAH